MTNLVLREFGKASHEGNKLSGSAQIIVNADGTKPYMHTNFNVTLNEVMGETVLVHSWNKANPRHYTIGRSLRKDYAEALKMRKGMFRMKGEIVEDYNVKVELSFIDSTTPDFEVLTFNDILFVSKENVIQFPSLGVDEYEVFLEEALTGLLQPAFQCLLRRCQKVGFVSRLYHGFMLNRFQVPIDQRESAFSRLSR